MLPGPNPIASRLITSAPLLAGHPCPREEGASEGRVTGEINANGNRQGLRGSQGSRAGGSRLTQQQCFHERTGGLVGGKAERTRAVSSRNVDASGLAKSPGQSSADATACLAPLSE